jgi:hypothetical protein
MKNLMTISLMLIGTNVFASDVVLKLSTASMEMLPMTRTVTVLETGAVKEVKTVRGVKSSQELKSVSPNLVQKIKDLTEKLDPKAKLVDLDAGKPRCMGGGTSHIYATKNNKEVEVGGFTSCHQILLNSPGAKELVKIVTDINSRN